MDKADQAPIVRTTGLTLKELLGICLTAIESGASPDAPVIICVQDNAGQVCAEGAAFAAGTFADILEYRGERRDGFVIDASTYYPIDGYKRQPMT